MATNFGLNDSLSYNELVLDSTTCLNSFQSTSSSSDWPLFNIDQIPDVAAIKVLEVQLPFSFYVITELNNTFYLRENGETNTAWSKVIMQTGNYTIDLLKISLQDSLISASLNGKSYTVDYSQDVMKLKITSSSSSNSFSLSMKSTTLPELVYDSVISTETRRAKGFGFNPYRTSTTQEINNPGLWFGFESSATYTSTTGANPFLVSPNVFNVSGPDYVYVCSRSLGPFFKLYLPDQQGGGSDGPQIAKIPVLVNTGDIIFWQDPDPQKYFACTTLANSFDIYCSLGANSEFVPLEFNGLGFSIKLGILTSDTTHSTNLGGGVGNNRVVNRTWHT